ncbi:MAG: acetyl-CoA carboxylase biotin carboxyl carrier protein subunit, partial [Clostridia bacterium]|nr:acetyl-CoA carboxylase biotin carboxyl carrier protein subunit [Clostridia bacterium]
GTVYEVEIEDITGTAPAARPAAPKAAAPKPAPKAAPAPAAAPAGKGESINAPMPGNILDVKVANGQAVTAGQILMILEAMKMENEIIAPCAGTVSNLSVQKGSTVSSGQLLCSIG